MIGKYTPENTIRFEGWYCNGNLYYDMTESNAYWDYFYSTRHYPYPNISTNENICDLVFLDTASNYRCDRLWAL